jgi:amidase
MTDLTRLSATEILDGLRAGTFSCETLMQATLDQIAAVNGPVNAIVAQPDSDDLLGKARSCDAVPFDQRGPLHGLPFAVKDLVDVAGLLSSHGSLLFSDNIPETDDLIAERLRGAGAIFIGKTNTPEFGLGSHTFNPVHGATRNPYDLAKSCGGSSGGAAVALATGMVALADGSDMMGSLRNPAAWNNVYGFRPSWGVVPGDPKGDRFLHQLSTLGPMGRSPADMALLLDVMAGGDARLPHSRPYRAISPLPDSPKSARIGWLGDWDGAFPTEPGILDLCRAGLAVFETFGATVSDVSAPFDADAMWDAWVDLRSWQVAAGLKQHLDQPELLKDSAQWELRRGMGLSAQRIHDMSVVRSDWFATATALFDQFDVLVLPSAQMWPFDVDVKWPTQINGQAMDTYHRWMQVVVPVSLLGLPSVAVPAGFGATGLPMGFQMFGPRGSDADLLALAQSYHDATLWPQRRPAMI